MVTFWLMTKVTTESPAPGAAPPNPALTREDLLEALTIFSNAQDSKFQSLREELRAKSPEEVAASAARGAGAAFAAAPGTVSVGKIDSSRNVKALTPKLETTALATPDQDAVQWLQMLCASIEREHDRISKTDTIHLGDSSFHEGMFKSKMLSLLKEVHDGYQVEIKTIINGKKS